MASLIDVAISSLPLSVHRAAVGKLKSELAIFNCRKSSGSATVLPELRGSDRPPWLERPRLSGSEE